MTRDLYMPNEDWEGNKQQERGRERNMKGNPTENESERREI